VRSELRQAFERLTLFADLELRVDATLEKGQFSRCKRFGMN